MIQSSIATPTEIVGTTDQSIVFLYVILVEDDPKRNRQRSPADDIGYCGDDESRLAIGESEVANLSNNLVHSVSPSV